MTVVETTMTAGLNRRGSAFCRSSHKLLLVCATSFFLLGALLSSSARAQRPAVSAGYSGFYSCLQGLTAVTLQVVQHNTGPEGAEVIFSFGPSPSNPYVPFGRFYLRGDFDTAGGILFLLPVRWVAQPPGYVMIGLSGVSRDGGNTFEGSVIGGVGCTAFSVHRMS
jgi:hypothetical protein